MSDQGGQSVIGCLQLLSDKSQIFLSANAAQFYSLHATLLNVLENGRRRHILSGIAFVAYLPVTLERDDQGTEHSPPQQILQRNVRRIESTEAVHDGNCTTLFALADVSMAGFHVHCQMRIESVFTFYLHPTLQTFQKLGTF